MSNVHDDRTSVFGFFGLITLESKIVRLLVGSSGLSTLSLLYWEFWCAEDHLLIILLLFELSVLLRKKSNYCKLCREVQASFD